VAQNINDLAHHSGRFLRENSETLNIPDWLEAMADSDEDGIVTKDIKLEAIHLGNSFTAFVDQTVSDIGDQTIIAFLTGALSPHITFLFSAGDIASATLLESPNIADNTGVPVTIFNRDRTSANAPTVIDTSTNPDTAGQATYFDEVAMGNVVGGTAIWSSIIGTAGHWSAGGGYFTVNEWVLLPDTAYAWVIESQTTNDNYCLTRLNWVEH